MTEYGKTILITGCSSGIGNALARACRGRGMRVFATARNLNSITDLQDLGIECFSLVVDDPASVQKCYEEVSQLIDFAGLDYLVNNAGRNYTVPALEISLPEVQATFSTNLFGVMLVNQTFAPLLLTARGTIVHIGSLAAIIPYVWGSVYNASKAALHAYSNTLRVELQPFGVHVITVVTGGVKSNIARTERTLQRDSLYKPLEEQFERRQKHSQEVGMDTGVYALEVVEKMLMARGWFWSSNEIWAGSRSGLVWWMDWVDRLVPGGVFGFAMRRMFGLNKLRKGRFHDKIL